METPAKGEMKIVGRRKPMKAGNILAAQGFFELAASLRAGKPSIPRGVYRFRSHDEKDAWILKMLTR
jgi:hypothetical protein